MKTPNQPENPTEQIEQPPKKKLNPAITVTIAVIVTAALVGAGVYAWQKNANQKEITELQSQMDILEQEMQEQNTNTKELPLSQSATLEAGESTENDSLSYVNSVYGYSISYPSSAELDSADASCVEIAYKESRILVSKDNELYPCGPTGIGIGPEPVSESVTADNKAYTASGFRSNDDEQLSFRTDSGVGIVYLIDGLDRLQPLTTVEKEEMRQVMHDIIASFTTIPVSIPEYCTAAPTPQEIGRYQYSIAEKYVALDHLGELFTAASCGEPRVIKLDSVTGTTYTPGVHLILQNTPSPNLLETLEVSGFTCKAGVTSKCTDWQLEKSVPIKDILQLAPFYQEFTRADCIHCG